MINFFITLLIQMSMTRSWIFIDTGNWIYNFKADLLEQEQPGFEPRTFGFKTNRSTIVSSTHRQINLQSLVVE